MKKRTKTAKHPPEVVQKIKKLRSKGVAPAEIASTLNVSRSSISKFSARVDNGIHGRPRKSVVTEGFFDDGGLCPITGFKA